MKKIFIAFAFVAFSLTLFAFSPVGSNANYSDFNKTNRKLDKEVSSFTEMYTRTYLSDNSVWAHRHKDFTISETTTSISTLESALDRN